MNTKLEKFIKDINNPSFDYILNLLTKNYVLDLKVTFEHTVGNKYRLSLKTQAIRDANHCIDPKHISDIERIILSNFSKLLIKDSLLNKVFSFSLPDCLSSVDWLDITISNHFRISAWMYTKLDDLSIYIDEKTISAQNYTKHKLGNPMLQIPTKEQKAVLNTLIKEIQTHCTLRLADILNEILHIRNYSKDMDINYLEVKSNYIK